MAAPSTSSKQTQETADKHRASLQAREELQAASVQSDALPAELQIQGQEAQVDLLGNQEVPTAQRQAIATRIGRTQGNRYLQRVVDQVVQRDEDQPGATGSAPGGPTSKAQAQIPPELLKSIDPSLLNDTQLQFHLQLIEHTLLHLDPASADAQRLLKMAEQMKGAMTERKVEAKITQELEAFLTQFSNIKVTVRWKEGEGDAQVEKSQEVAVHPPYFMNVTKASRKRAGKRTLERYDTAVANRRAADRATRRLLREIYKREKQGGLGIGRARFGKSHPEDIRKILQTALDRNLIKGGKGRTHPNGDDLRAWLIRYGIGVDCSGFVSQALNQVVAQVRGTPLTAKERIKKGAASLKGGVRGFTKIKDPTQLKAGDTMAIPGHIRIILSVSRTAGGVQFVTGESRAGGKADVGPDRVQWRYVKGRLQKKGSGSTKWVNSKETPVFGRYKLLQKAREGAVKAQAQSTP